MLRIEVLTVFLTMPLSIAVMKFMESQQRSWCSWLIFIYFILNEIRFFDGDVKVSRMIDCSQKANIAPLNALSFFLGTTSKFLFIVMALHIDDPLAFFGFYGLTLFFDLFWILAMRETIDEAKPNGAHLRCLFKKWTGLDLGRGATLLSAALAMHLLRNEPDIVNYIQLGCLLVCYVLLAFDYAMNFIHYFEKK